MTPKKVADEMMAEIESKFCGIQHEYSGPVPYGEPHYIVQCNNPDNLHELQAYFKRRRAEATMEGCTFFRFTIHPQHPIALIEGWKVQPKDQGKPRFSIQAAT